MNIVDEITFENSEPKCVICGKPLTREEWELDEICEKCYNLIEDNK